MNNLLRTLTEIQAKSPQHADLKLLLTTVKEARRQTLESKLSDPFYDSLEGLLLDLRTVTIDNRDAEPFLKPVSRTEYPDYYEVIATPMDLQSMLKKVKAKSYKSKREFQDDLDLIWANCFQFNSVEGHPIRQSAMRLRLKAENLLKYITDRKDRADPAVPGDIQSRGITPKVNGVTLNGISRARSIQPSKSPSPIKFPAEVDSQSRRDVPFPDSSAIIRTPAGMSTFGQLDQELDTRLAALNLENGYHGWGASLEERLKMYAVDVEEEDGDRDVSLKTHDGDIGEKRKLNGYVDSRPRKRARMSPENSSREVVDLWWDAMRSDELIGNGLPTLQVISSDPGPSKLSATMPTTDSSQPQFGRPKKKRKKKLEIAQPRTLLYHMNNNIKTMRKVRSTHAKFAVLNQTNEDGTAQPPEFLPPPPDDVEEPIDERPWRAKGSGTDVGSEQADHCLHWAGSKVLEHVGFQGASKAALDVLAGVTSDFLLNVGRTISFLSDKYANKMTPEEIILHTLFESGISRIAELDRYIKDDIIRHGARLSELDKKLTNAYAEATVGEAWDDDALFKMEDEEEEGEFVMGNFADSFGEDFLGLRELGIAAEFGLASLTVPKKLLKGKNKGAKEGPSAAKPSEPPLPFPLPPTFIPIDSENVENQIGLLKPFYQDRIAAVAASQPQPSTQQLPFPDVNGGADYKIGYPAVPYPPQPPVNAPIVLPDDPPNPAHTKIGPLGQVIKTAASGGSKKKSKAKPKEVGDSAGLILDGFIPEGGLETPVMTPNYFPSESPKKNKGASGPNAGTGGKKKAKAVDPPLPPVVMAGA